MQDEQPTLETLFWECSQLESPKEQTALLDKLCSGHPTLRSEVEKLLAARADASRFEDCVFPQVSLVAKGEQEGGLVGPYKLLQEIAHGGMGVVYLAEQSQPVKRLVAIKIVKPGMDSDEILARFEAERQALAIMDHPNIAKVFDAGPTSTGRPYFAMELVKGQPITTFCDECKLPTRQRLELFIQVCRGIQHAHHKGIIHRDIKPSNILVALYDSVPVPKIIDFGVAKAIGDSLTQKTFFTRFGQVVGTFEYMSPEQVQFNQLDIDTRSDVYSLGVLLYELLTGHPPFPANRLRAAGLKEVIEIIREEEPLRPSIQLSTAKTKSIIAANHQSDPARLAFTLRGDLDWIVTKALEKDRERRYSTATALADDIARYLDLKPVEACPPSPLYRFRKYLRRHKLPLAATALVLIAIFAGAGFSVWYAFDAQAARNKAEESDDLANQRLALLQEQHQMLTIEQQAVERNFTLAKQTVAKLIDEIAKEKVIAFPELADFRTTLLATADEFYSKLLEEKPKNADLLIARGTVRIRLNRMEDGLGDFLLASEFHPEDARIDKVLADFYRNATSQAYRDPALALRYAERAVELEPMHSDHWSTLAWVQMNSYGRKQESSDAMRRSAELTENIQTRKQRLAIATELAGNYGLAIDDYSRILAEQPGPDAVARGELLLRRGRCYLHMGRHEDAITDFTESIRFDGFNALAYEHRAFCYFAIRSYRQALDDWNRAISLVPRLGEDAIPRWIVQVGSQGLTNLIPGEREGALLSLGHVLECYVSLEDWPGAATLLSSRSGKLSGDRSMLNVDLVRRIKNSGDNRLNLACNQFVDRVLFHLRQQEQYEAASNYCRQIGDYQKAIEICGEWIVAAGDDVTAEMYLFRAEIYRDNIQHYAEAAKDYERAYTRLRPSAHGSHPLVKHIWLQSELAVLQLRSQDLDGYESTCRRMLELCDQNKLPTSLENVVLWDCLLGSNHIIEHEDLITRINRNHAEDEIKNRGEIYHLLMGAALLRAGRHEGARQHLKQAIISETTTSWGARQNSRAKYLLSRAEFHLGNTADAEKYFNEAGQAPRVIWDEEFRRDILKKESERLLLLKN